MFTFDAAYFDGAYFDTGDVPPTPKAWGHPGKRIRPTQTVRAPAPASEEDEEFLALLEAFDG